MRIDRIDLFHVAMPLKFPWRTAYGEDASVESVLCRIESGSIVGWGEASPFAAPCYSSDWARGVFAVCQKWLAPALLGAHLTSGAELQQRLAIFKGNPFAKAVLDTAWWSLESRRTGRPLHHLLGGERDAVLVGADFGAMDSIDDLVDAVGRAVEQGFPRVKLKFRPGWDREMLSAVRKTFPATTTHIDMNSGYRLEDTELWTWLDEQGLAMIEQPLRHDDLLDHATLQRSLRTPVCLDESLTGREVARQAIEVNACRYANIKPGRVGGLTIARDMIQQFQQTGIPCWVGGMLESAVGASHCRALATLANCTYPGDIFPSDRFYHEDLAAPPMTLDWENGLPVSRCTSDLPEPHPERLLKQTLQQATLRA